MKRALDIHRFGRIAYDEALALQAGLVEARRANRIADLLLLVEHPPVITVGVNGRREHVVATPERLRDLGVTQHATGRGGDVTYHGPGQVVGYPIVSLKPDRCDVHRYVRDLEEVMIRTTKDFGLPAARVPGMTGVWVGAEKIGAIGVRIARWITSHGFSYNVDPDLDHFKLIVPCGIRGRGVTSLARALGRPVPARLAEERLIRHFADVFDRAVVEHRRVAWAADRELQPVI